MAETVSLSPEIDPLPSCLQSLARLIAPLPGAAMVARLGGEIAVVNAAFVELFGHISAESVGKSPDELIGSERHSPSFFRDIEARLRGGEDVHAALISRCKDGRLVRHAVLVAPVHDAEGGIGWWMSYHHHRRPQAAPLASREDAVAETTLLSVRAAEIDHKRCGPLSQLIAHTQPPHAPRPVDERDPALTEGLEAIQRTLEELLEPPADDPVRPRPMVLSTILSQAISAEDASLRRVQVRLDGVPEHLQVLAVPRLVESIADLIRRAAQSISEEQTSAEVRITARADDQHVQLWIIDTGSGQSAEHRERGQAAGEGLIRQLGGSLTIAPRRRRQGTMVTVRLRRADAAPSSKAEPDALRVLIVDDDTRVSKALGRLLVRHRVELSDSGEDALSRLIAEPFDVVICDLMMPGMSGLELFDRLEREHPAIARRFLFTTGGAWSAQSRAFISKHSRRVITKPFKRERLNRSIDWIVRIHQA